MTLRRIIPYLILALLFALVYLFTMIVSNEILFLGFEQESRVVLNNDKIQLQMIIFTLLLPLTIVGINFLEYFTTNNDNLFIRLSKSIVTIVIIFIATALIYKFGDFEVVNMFYSYRGTPALVIFPYAIFLTIVGIALLEGLIGVYSIWFNKSFINKFIPRWLKMEKRFYGKLIS